LTGKSEKNARLPNPRRKKRMIRQSRNFSHHWNKKNFARETSLPDDFVAKVKNSGGNPLMARFWRDSSPAPPLAGKTDLKFYFYI